MDSVQVKSWSWARTGKGYIWLMLTVGLYTMNGHQCDVLLAITNPNPNPKPGRPLQLEDVKAMWGQKFIFYAQIQSQIKVNVSVMVRNPNHYTLGYHNVDGNHKDT